MTAVTQEANPLLKNWTDRVVLALLLVVGPFAGLAWAEQRVIYGAVHTFDAVYKGYFDESTLVQGSGTALAGVTAAPLPPMRVGAGAAGTSTVFYYRTPVGKEIRRYDAVNGVVTDFATNTGIVSETAKGFAADVDGSFYLQTNSPWSWFRTTEATLVSPFDAALVSSSSDWTSYYTSSLSPTPDAFDVDNARDLSIWCRGAFIAVRRRLTDTTSAPVYDFPWPDTQLCPTAMDRSETFAGGRYYFGNLTHIFALNPTTVETTDVYAVGTPVRVLFLYDPLTLYYGIGETPPYEVYELTLDATTGVAVSTPRLVWSQTVGKVTGLVVFPRSVESNGATPTPTPTPTPLIANSPAPASSTPTSAGSAASVLSPSYAVMCVCVTLMFMWWAVTIPHSKRNTAL